MFWTRSAAATTPATDASAAPSVLQSATSRSMGFLSSLDPRGASESRANAANQSAGENARQELAALDGDSALPPSYILSEQRRNELLAAARATRTSWVDGDNDANANARENGDAKWTSLGSTKATTAAGNVPKHCQQAVEQIAVEMQSLVASLDQLKRKIIPTDVFAGVDDDQGRGDNNEKETNRLVTIAEELRVLKGELESWRRVHLVNGKLSPLQRKRLTASDKEFLFLAAFQELLAVLKLPQAAETVYQIQIFVQKFEHWNLEVMLRHRAVQDRPGGHVQAFIDKLAHQLQRTGSALFSAADAQILSLEDDEDQLLHEVLEAFLFEKLYQKALTPSTKAEQEDEALHERLASLSFVEFRHLDLPAPVNDEVRDKWQALTEQLAMISKFPSPRRKMDCVMRVCQDLTTLLSSLHADGKFPSADEFLPGLIYLLLKSNPLQLKRNVHFILEYRRPSRLVSEPGYFFTHLVSSVAFLEQVNGELLTITPEEFEAGLQHSKQQVADGNKDISTARTQVILAASQDKSQDDTMVDPEPAPEPRLPTVLEVRARRLAALNSQVAFPA